MSQLFDDDESVELEVTLSFTVPADEVSGIVVDPHELARLTRERWIEDPDLLHQVVGSTDDFDLQVRPFLA